MEDANTAKQVFIEKSKQIENAAKEKPNQYDIFNEAGFQQKIQERKLDLSKMSLQQQNQRKLEYYYVISLDMKMMIANTFRNRLQNKPKSKKKMENGQ